jgi:hypothetical protein
LRFDDRDRRRLGFATVLTIAALPAVWIANRDDPATGPNLAAVGLASDGGAPSTTADAAAIDPMGDVAAEYLEGGSTLPRPVPVPIAVGASDGRVVATGQAIFRRAVGNVDHCLFAGVAPGEMITVINVDNGRSTECRTRAQTPEAPAGELVMHPDRFVQIADLMSAPVDIEVRQ